MYLTQCSQCDSLLFTILGQHPSVSYGSSYILSLFHGFRKTKILKQPTDAVFFSDKEAPQKISNPQKDHHLLISNPKKVCALLHHYCSWTPPPPCNICLKTWWWTWELAVQILSCVLSQFIIALFFFPGLNRVHWPWYWLSALSFCTCCCLGFVCAQTDMTRLSLELCTLMTTQLLLKCLRGD